MYLTCRRSIKSRYKIYLLFPSYQGIQGVKLGSVQPHDLKLKFKNLIFLVFFFFVEMIGNFLFFKANISIKVYYEYKRVKHSCSDDKIPCDTFDW